MISTEAEETLFRAGKGGGGAGVGDDVPGRVVSDGLDDDADIDVLLLTPGCGDIDSGLGGGKGAALGDERPDQITD